jgi:hypothetical protein
MNNEKEHYTGLADLYDGNGNKINLSDFAKKKTETEPKEAQNKAIRNSLPDHYIGKSWDELYQLEAIRKNHPDHYEKLKTEKYKKID